MNKKLVGILNKRGLMIKENTSKNELMQLIRKSFHHCRQGRHNLILSGHGNSYYAYYDNEGRDNLLSLHGGGDTEEDAIGMLILHAFHFEQTDYVLKSDSYLRTDNDPALLAPEWNFIRNRGKLVLKRHEDEQKKKELQWESGIRPSNDPILEKTRDFNDYTNPVDNIPEKRWVCLICGWRGTEEERIKTYTEETVMGLGPLKPEDNQHFYEMGFRAGWDCGPLVEDIGQPVRRILCDEAMYNSRIDYYKTHPKLVYATDDKIRQGLD